MILLLLGSRKQQDEFELKIHLIVATRKLLSNN